MQRWHLTPPTVLYDRPANDLLHQRLDHTEPFFFEQRTTQLSRILALDPRQISPTTKILLSSTSWSADEDFSLLLDALVEYEKQAARHASEERPPHLMVVLTGTGPLREFYETKFASHSFRHVTVLTRWLPYQDYLSLLTLIDLGLCFHRSSSGVDLPMKILDFFGAGAPVCAFDYGVCIRELVSPDATGYLFQTGQQLAEQIARLCAGTVDTDHRLAAMRASVIAQHTRAWSDEWRDVASTVFALPN